MLFREKVNLHAPFLLMIFVFGLIIGGCNKKQRLLDSSGPPDVTSTTPEDNEENVSVTTSIKAAFDQPMEESTINESTFILESDTDTLSVLVSTNDTTAVLTFSDSLAYGTAYQASLSPDIVGAEGEALPNKYQWNFTTEDEGIPEDGGDDETENDQDSSGDDGNGGNGDDQGDGSGGKDDASGDGSGNSDTVPPSVTDIDPDEHTAGVPVDITVSATFNEEMDGSTFHLGTVFLEGPSGEVQGAVNTIGNEITFLPEKDLENNAEYIFTITTGVTDLSGNELQREYSMVFNTEVDNVPPRVISSDPPDNGRSGLPVDIDIKITFSEEIDPNTVNYTLYDTGTEAYYPTTISVSENVMTLSQDSTFRYSGALQLIIFEAEDLAGNSLQSEYSTQFSTERPPVTTPPTVVSANPGDGERNVSVNTEITVVFSAEMYPYSFSDQSVTLEGPNGEVPARLNADNNTLIIYPDNEMEPASTYTYTISYVRDIYRNILERYSATFTTEEAPIADNN